MAKVVVLPPWPTVSFASVAATAAVAVGLPDPRQTLAARAQALHSFARTVLMNSGPALGMARRIGPAAAAVAAVPYRVLEGVGALIAERDIVDRVALRAMGAQVFENVEIPLVDPVAKGAESVTELTSAHTWHLDKIDVARARAAGLTGQGILVGILDTGIDASHPEFSGKTIHFQEFDGNGAPLAGPVRDADVHGTHVSGIVAGRSAGVAPMADLAVAAVLTHRTPQGMSGTLAQILAGLNWLLVTNLRPGGDPGVDVANASLGAPGYNDYLHRALANARVAPGTLLCASIGNSGRWGVNYHGSPGNYDVTLGVGATDVNDTVADFSDWGTVEAHAGLRKPDLSAPGVDVWSSVPGAKYAAMSGTSMASPVVTGACALLLQRDASLGVDVPGLQKAILRMTVNTGDPRAGRGRFQFS
jgi:subtilisin family serine protease